MGVAGRLLDALHLAEPFAGAAGHQGDVGGDGGVVVAVADEALHHVGIRADDADGLAGRMGVLRRLLDQRLHLGMGDIADMAHGGREVAGADEQRIDALDGGDLRQALDGLRRFELHDGADVVVCGFQVIRDRAEARAAMHGRDAPDAMRRIARIGRGGPRLLGILHEGQHDGARAGIERALHQHLVVPGEPHHAVCRRAADGAQDMGEIGELDRHMLHVDHEEIEAAIAEGFRRRGRGGHQPGAERGGARSIAEPGLEGVVAAHGLSLNRSAVRARLACRSGNRSRSPRAPG